MRRAFALWALLLLFSFDAAAESAPASKSFTWGGDASGGAPYISLDPAHPGVNIGFEVDLAELLSKEMGLMPVFVQNQWDSLIPGLKRGNYDFVINGIEITDDRKAEIDFSDPYFLSYEALTVRKDNYDIATLEDLKGKHVGSLKGSLAERILKAKTDENGKPFMEVLGYDNQTTLYDDLANGRVEAILFDQPAALYYGGIDPRLKNLKGQFAELAYGICVRKGQSELLARLNKALHHLIQTGEIRRLYERWNIWNSVMAQTFHDNSPGHAEPTAYQAYLKAVGVQQGWRAKLAQYMSYIPLLAHGAVTTIELSFISMFFAVVLGLTLALTRLYGNALFSGAALVYIEFVRGTPLLIQLFFIYYGLPNLGVKITPFASAVLGLGLNYGAYEAEVYRAGIRAIPHAQMEAAQALNFTRWQALRHVIIPQAMRIVLPPTTNDFISLLKDSSLVSVITMVELTRVYGMLANTYYDYFGIGILTALAYFIIGLPFVRLSRWAERRYA